MTHGISPSFSAPHSHNQLGVAERYWRTLANMARTFINSSKLDGKFRFAFSTANHICNRVSIKSTPGELSFQLLGVNYAFCFTLLPETEPWVHENFWLQSFLQSTNTLKKTSA